MHCTSCLSHPDTLSCCFTAWCIVIWYERNIFHSEKYTNAFRLLRSRQVFALFLSTWSRFIRTGGNSANYLLCFQRSLESITLGTVGVQHAHTHATECTQLRISSLQYRAKQLLFRRIKKNSPEGFMSLPGTRDVFFCLHKTFYAYLEVTAIYYTTEVVLFPLKKNFKKKKSS